MKKHIPNLLTLANLFCGACSLAFVFAGEIGTAAWFTGACFVFDYMDGMLARALKVHSPLGKELDSLADVVSFGVVPGAMVFHLLSNAVCGGADGFELTSSLKIRETVCLAALPAFVLSAVAGLRLAKFNLDTRQTSYFIGLTTPATTVFVLGLTLAAYHDRFGLREIIENQWLLYGLTAVLSWFLVSEIPMFGMKIKRFSLSDNWLPLIFAVVFVVAAWFLKELALSAIIVFYILTSIFLKNKITAGS